MAQKTKIRRRSGKKACFVQTSKIFKVFHVRVLIAETVLFWNSCMFSHHSITKRICFQLSKCLALGQNKTFFKSVKSGLACIISFGFLVFFVRTSKKDFISFVSEAFSPAQFNMSSCIRTFFCFSELASFFLVFWFS